MNPLAFVFAAASLFQFDTARALYRAEQYRDALKYLEASEQVGEAAPLRPLYRGMCLAQLGKWQEARSELEPFVQAHPTDPDGWYWL
ncbi:MAG: CDC27 family protein, partial [Bryobacteraceae bacterium]